MTELGGIFYAVRQPRPVRDFRTADDRAKAAQQFMLLNQPGRLTIPPRHRGKCRVKSDVPQSGNCPPIQSWGPSQESAMGNALLDAGDNVPPEIRWHRTRIFASKSSGSCAREASQALDPPGRNLLGDGRILE